MAITQEQDYIFDGNVEHNGDVTVKTGSTLTIEDGATNGYVLTSDASGVASWQAPPAVSGLLQQAIVTITSTQIKNIKTTPVVLVAAQGANTVIVPVTMNVAMTYATTPYATDTILRAFISVQQIGLDNGALVATANYFSNRSLTTNYSISGVISVSNADLILTTATSDPTAGDSDIKVIVTYYVVNI